MKSMAAGVVGCGKIGVEGHVLNIKRNPNTELFTVCDQNFQIAKEVANRFNVNAYDNLDEMLTN